MTRITHRIFLDYDGKPTGETNTTERTADGRTITEVTTWRYKHRVIYTDTNTFPQGGAVIDNSAETIYSRPRWGSARKAVNA